jgi:hypothetical protein
LIFGAIAGLGIVTAFTAISTQRSARAVVG